jgi:hypothetical protein
MQRLAPYQPSSTKLLLRTPVLWAVGAFIGAGTAVLAGMLVALVVLGGTAGAACVALRTPRGRRWSERFAQRAAQRIRREHREARLEEAGVCGHALAAATLLVDQITATDPALAASLELEALLDRYVELEITTKRYERMLTGSSAAAPKPGCSATRALIHGRSEALRRTCEAWIADARDELAATVELLQFLLQRSVLAATEPQSDPVGDCIALLED